MRGVIALTALYTLLAGTIVYGKDPAPKIGEAQARKVALSQVAGTIKSSEVERERGKLIYSFDIVQPNVSGVEEVHVDAMTGRFLGRHHESAAKEAVESKFEKLEAKVHRK